MIQELKESILIDQVGAYLLTTFQYTFFSICFLVILSSITDKHTIGIL